jgi:hypothetical protein
VREGMTERERAQGVASKGGNIDENDGPDDEE